MALVLKRKNNSDEITAADDAALIYSSIGDGILEKVFNGMTCSVNSSTKKITISSGVLLFGGRMVVIESGTTYELDVTSLWSGSGQISVICEMTIAEDDEDSSVTIYASRSTSETTTSPLLVGTHRKKIFQFYPSNLNRAYNAIMAAGFATISSKLSKIVGDVFNDATSLAKECLEIEPNLNHLISDRVDSVFAGALSTNSYRLYRQVVYSDSVLKEIIDDFDIEKELFSDFKKMLKLVTNLKNNTIDLRGS